MSRSRCLALGLSVWGSLLAIGLRASAEDPPLPSFLLVRTDYSAGVIEEYAELPIVRRRYLDARARAPGSGPLRWLTLGGQQLPAGRRVPKGGIRLLPVGSGVATLPMKDGPKQVGVVSVHPLRMGKEFDPKISHWGMSREPPAELSQGRKEPETESESVVFVLAGPADALPSTIGLFSKAPGGSYLDSIRSLALASAPCPRSVELKGRGASTVCASTLPIRLVGDVTDRNHPASAHRTILGEVGGSLHLKTDAQATYRISAGGPTEMGVPSGPGRYRVGLRVQVLRTFKGGVPSVGQDEAETVQVIREAVQAASRMWGQCGVHLGSAADLSVEVVDPPETPFLTVGCSEGLPASGGSLEFSVAGRRIFVRTWPGQSPLAVTSRLSSVLQKSGFYTRIYRNAQVKKAALPTFDIEIEDRSGRRPKISVLRDQGMSTDSTLGLCPGNLELADGLEHFYDYDSASGTQEERALLRALSDDDPSTIELIIVPSFSGMGRIGESFIFHTGSSLRNAIIVDRSGLRAGSRSSTIAHELGHILLDLPGHPDDFGVDQPTLLMDADAADATVFGPRRLTLAECQRAIRQSGPEAQLPLLRPWPLSAEN